jgi:hypothetical protein
MAERMHMSPIYLGEVERGTRKRGRLSTSP